jgi:hypothetical protein
MKGLHLTLRLAEFGGGREAFAYGLALDLAGQTEVGAVARLVGLMTMAVWFSATAMDSGDGAAAKITQLQELTEQSGTMLFEGGEGVRQKGPPIRTYIYVRIITTKKKTAKSALYVSRTRRRPAGVLISQNLIFYS